MIDWRDVPLLLAVMALGILAWVVIASLAEASPRPVPADECGTETTADMVRLRVAELGPTLELQRVREGDALWWVLVRRRRALRRYVHPEVTYREALHAYAGDRLRHPPHARAREVAGLEPSEHPAIQRRARAWCAGEVRDPCPACHHWGMPEGLDLRRARRAGWGRAGIGRHLAFWTPGGAS